MTSTLHRSVARSRRPVPERRPADPPDSRAPWPLHGAPLRSPWRLPAAVGAVTEAAAHIPVIEEHLSEAPYIGVGFVLLVAAGLVLAQLLLAADSTRVWLATAVVSGLALAGYIASRSIRLPQIHDDIGNWTDPLGLMAIGAEALMLTAAAGAWLTHARGRAQ